MSGEEGTSITDIWGCCARHCNESGFSAFCRQQATHFPTPLPYVMLQYSPLSGYSFQLGTMAALDPKRRQQQLTYIAQLGADSAFTLDTDAATTAEFTRLAVEYLGWVSRILTVWARRAHGCTGQRRRAMVQALEKVLPGGISI